MATDTCSFHSPVRCSRRQSRCFCGRRLGEDLRDQTVAVIGLGVSGRAAVKLALSRGASIVAIDRNEQWRPPPEDPVFLENDRLQMILGECDEAILENVDRVVVSPGVSLEKYGLRPLLQSGRKVMSELDFAAQVLPDEMKILAVTGTNGKSTVTSFAAQILHQLGIKTFVGGNLGIPLSDAAMKFLKTSAEQEIYQVAVVEVSSAQMEIPSSYFHPSVALVLNLTPDHLGRHKTMQNYAATKCRVFSHMKHGKLAVIPVGNQYINEAFISYENGCNVAWIGKFPGIMMDKEEKLAGVRNHTTQLDGHLNLAALRAIGSHNYHNAAVAAFAVLGLGLGLDMESISKTFHKLCFLPHRIQVVCRDANGVTWVDDSKATNMGATYVGLMALKERNLIVLLGGIAKSVDNKGSTGFEDLIEILRHHRGVITFGSSGEAIYRALLHGGLETPCVRVDRLEDAVSYAKRMATHGDTVLLTPGCASLDEFKDFEHRGRSFQRMAQVPVATVAVT